MTTQREAYDMVDRYMRNNMDDVDYDIYSKALDEVLGTAQAQQATVGPVAREPNFCESCAMDLSTCDCVEPRPTYVQVAQDHTAAMRAALDALENSVGVVWEEYTHAYQMYSNYPTRKARLNGMKALADAHDAAITQLRAALGEQG